MKLTPDGMADVTLGRTQDSLRLNHTGWVNIPLRNLLQKWLKRPSSIDGFIIEALNSNNETVIATDPADLVCSHPVILESVGNFRQKLHPTFLKENIFFRK